jgi:hypothetical protein
MTTTRLFDRRLSGRRREERRRCERRVLCLIERPEFERRRQGEYRITDRRQFQERRELRA